MYFQTVTLSLVIIIQGCSYYSAVTANNGKDKIVKLVVSPTPVVSNSNEEELGNTNADFNSADNSYNPIVEIKTDSDKVVYKGCWSNGTGDWLRIDDKNFRTSINSYKPIRYTRQRDSEKNGKVVLELANHQSAYTLRPVVVVYNAKDTLNDAFLMDVTGYETLEETQDGEPTATSSWVEQSCAHFPKMNKKL